MSDTRTVTLAEFLLARIAEDEAAARAGISSQADPENGWGLIEYQGMAGLSLSPHVGHVHERVQGEHIIRWHPARVLAECEAKRRIVAMQAENDDQRHQPGFHYKAQMIEGVLRSLALPYADHPDYRESWRP